MDSETARKIIAKKTGINIDRIGVQPTKDGWHGYVAANVMAYVKNDGTFERIIPAWLKRRQEERKRLFS